MAAYTFSAISEFLEKVIARQIENQLPNQTVLWDQIKDNGKPAKMDNDAFYITLRSGRHAGISWTPSGESNLIVDQKDTRAQTKVDAKFGYGAFRMDHKILTVSEKGVIADVLEAASQGLLADMTKHVNRQAFGYGNGQVALANGAGSSVTTLVVDTPGTKYLAAGMKIIIGAGSAVTISSVDSDTQVTLSAARSWSDNDVVKMATQDGTAADEMMGLGGIYDDGGRVGTLQNLSRTTNFWWKLPAAQLNTASAAISESSHMNPVYFGALPNNQSPKKPRYLWIMSTNVFSTYGNSLTSMKKSADLKEVLKGGWMGLEYMNGVPVVMDDDCPSGEAYLVDLNAIGFAKLAPLGFLPAGDGKGVLGRVPGTSLYEAIAFLYGNFYANNVRSGGALRNKS